MTLLEVSTKGTKIKSSLVKAPSIDLMNLIDVEVYTHTTRECAVEEQREKLLEMAQSASTKLVIFISSNLNKSI